MSDTVLVALIVACTTVLTGVMSLVGVVIARQVQATHQLVNSRMDELLARSVGQAHAEGVTQGEQDQRGREGV